MHKLLVFFVVIDLLQFNVVSQEDRYNYIQRPTETSALIAWQTNSPGIGTIQWGTDPFALTNSMMGSVSENKHHFELTGLSPNTQYFYQTSTNTGFLSDIDYFFTAKQSHQTDITFLHYGDCGYNNTIQNEIAALMENEHADFAVVSGDVDQGVGDNYNEVFFGVYENMLKNSCHYTAIGNHDTYYDNAATYLEEFYLPTNNPAQSERYYSFTWGNAKFICLDSNSPYGPGTEQYAWLVDELKCNEHQWLFTFFHHPPWTNAWDLLYYVPFNNYFQYEGNEDMRTQLVPLFEQYDVDFVLNGHSHCYQRGKMNDVHYVISGGAGSASIDANTNSNAPNIDTEIYTNQYVKFNIDGDFASYVCINQLGVVIDSVAAEKTGWTPITYPIIELDGQLIAPNGSSYTWYLDGLEIPNSNTSSFTPTSSGIYTVTFINLTGCLITSEEFNANNVGTVVLENEKFKVYPNPSNAFFYIEGNLKQIDQILITNSIGKTFEVETKNSTSNNLIKLDLSNYPTGIYFMKIITGSTLETIRLTLD